MAEIDDATVAARTKEILESDEAIKKFGEGWIGDVSYRKTNFPDFRGCIAGHDPAHERLYIV